MLPLHAFANGSYLATIETSLVTLILALRMELDFRRHSAHRSVGPVESLNQHLAIRYTQNPLCVLSFRAMQGSGPEGEGQCP